MERFLQPGHPARSPTTDNTLNPMLDEKENEMIEKGWGMGWGPEARRMCGDPG